METFSYSPFSVVPQASILQPPPPMAFAQFQAPAPFVPSSSGAQAPFLAASVDPASLAWAHTVGPSVFVGSAVMAATMNPALGFMAALGTFGALSAPSAFDTTFTPTDVLAVPFTGGGGN
jgi:hypothetical protein